jgi:lipid A 3-O-deacylase
MIRKTILYSIPVLLLILTVNTALAFDGLSLGIGKSRDNIDILRLGLVKRFCTHWFQSSGGYLSGFYDISLNYWKHENEHIYGFSMSPVLGYFIHSGIKGVTPYIHGGIGGAYITEIRIKERNLSSHLHFESRFGLGIQIGNHDVSMKYMHYSNGKLKMPNDGIDIFTINYIYYF